MPSCAVGKVLLVESSRGEKLEALAKELSRIANAPAMALYAEIKQRLTGFAGRVRAAAPALPDDPVANAAATVTIGNLRATVLADGFVRIERSVSAYRDRSPAL